MSDIATMPGGWSEREEGSRGCSRRGLPAAGLAFALGALALGGCSVATTDAIGTGDSEVTASLATDTVRPGDTLDGLRFVSTLPAPAGGSGERPISPDDLIEIDVFQVDELDRSVRVAENGTIALPLIGEVQAAGRSARQLEGDLRQRYGQDYLESPQISVFVKDSAGQKVTVDGQVRSAGIQPVTTSSSLVGVVAQAGGLTDIADASKIFVFREIGGERLVSRYDLKGIRSGKTRDPRIYGGDVVVVFDSASRTAMRNLRETLGVVRGAAGVLPI